MANRQIAEFEVSDISLGCMSLSSGYGAPQKEDVAVHLLNKALDTGYTMLDSAALYGFGHNEKLLSKIMHRRNEFMLASKGGMFLDEAGKRETNNTPAAIRRHCEGSLKRLNTDVIDLYYLHRWDKSIAIEEPIGEMARLKEEGKIRSLGLSEVSSKSLRKAHAEHPIAALQTEYSLWTRNPEISVLDTCESLDVAFVAFSPLARAFLTGHLRSLDEFQEGDLRQTMPRFQHDVYPQNLLLLEQLKPYAEQCECSLGQLALAWLLTRSKNIIPIPGTTNLDHLTENFNATHVVLDQDTIDIIGEIINQHTVQGTRYNPTIQKGIDTEEFV